MMYKTMIKAMMLAGVGFGAQAFADAVADPADAIAQHQAARQAFHVAFEACLTENNLSKPLPGQRPSEADRQAMDECLKTKGIAHMPHPGGRHRGSEEQPRVDEDSQADARS